MITNLIFKRQENIDGVTRVVTRIVPVDVPSVEAGEGWILSGHADVIEVPSTNVVTVMSSAQPELDEKNKAGFGAKFESGTSGTAKLVRTKNVIKIVARRGKSTYNQTTPNSVCISDFIKTEFFRHCKEYFGSSAGIFEFNIDNTKPYEYWNNFIDKEYVRQLEKHNESI